MHTIDPLINPPTMREQLLRDFFVGNATAAELAHDLEDAIIRTGAQSQMHPIEAMDTDFVVQPEHLIRLCDAVLAGQLRPESLEAVGFCLLGSDCFEWDVDSAGGERVADVAISWSVPVANYPLNAGTVAKFRHLLATGEDTFTGADLERGR